MEAADALWKLIGPYLAAEKLELDDLELVGHGRGRTLRVVVDGASGVDLDRLAEVSQGLSRLLDADAELLGPYQLEVTSPGLERKLRRSHHFAKSIGREVAAKVRGMEGSASVQGILVDVDGEGFTLDGELGRFQVKLADLVSARTVFRWEKAAKPGH